MQYRADTKDFVVIMKIFIICKIKCLNLDNMTAGFLSIVFQAGTAKNVSLSFTLVY